MTTNDFVNLDRGARLAILAEVQHHAGIESDEYCKLARIHERLLNRDNGGGPWRPAR
jgi:hypothetical protein